MTMNIGYLRLEMNVQVKSSLPGQQLDSWD
jgi:hypothetical protein